LIEFAKKRTAEHASRITFSVIDATDEEQLTSLGEAKFDAAISNMALFDMSNIEPLFRILPKLLKPGGAFIFSITHPCFNNASSMHVVEEMDDNGEIKTMYSVKVSRYMNQYASADSPCATNPNRKCISSARFSIISTSAFKTGLFSTVLKNAPSRPTFRKLRRLAGAENSARSPLPSWQGCA
jgi:SAM-dependent methyltransferase